MYVCDLNHDLVWNPGGFERKPNRKISRLQHRPHEAADRAFLRVHKDLRHAHIINPTTPNESKSTLVGLGWIGLGWFGSGWVGCVDKEGKIYQPVRVPWRALQQQHFQYGGIEASFYLEIGAKQKELDASDDREVARGGWNVFWTIGGSLTQNLRNSSFSFATCFFVLYLVSSGASRVM